MTELAGNEQAGELDIGLIGLAVMGQNLVLNMNDHGFRVGVHNRTTATTRAFLEGPAAGTGVVGFELPQELVAALKRPRRVMLMVKAGPAVDQVIAELLPYLEPGDIVIDGGNSNYQDSDRRTRELEKKGLLFVGTGVSGGEEGARRGPSIMPGGSPAAWPQVKNILQSIAAHVDGTPCCDWVGAGGAGHFVKMVHNGIEYGDMQLIGEAYSLMSRLLGMEAADIGAVFGTWNRGKLDSYLIEITAHILGTKDEDGQPLVEHILDVAGQKGTGKWTVVTALEEGVPLTLIAEAVFARFLSSLKDERLRAAEVLSGPGGAATPRRGRFITDLEQALYAAKLVSYAQGYMLMQAAGEEQGWNLDYGGIAQMWRGGCIIRSAFLGDIQRAYAEDPKLPNLLLAPFFRRQLEAAQTGWRKIAAAAVEHGVPIPAMSAGLAFYDGYRSAQLPANLLQAQRDYFGAHTYERTDRPRGQHFHTDWTGQGGGVTSGSYEA